MRRFDGFCHIDPGRRSTKTRRKEEAPENPRGHGIAGREPRRGHAVSRALSPDRLTRKVRGPVIREMAPTLRSYPVNLLPDPKLFPRHLFDARWKDPAVAARVSLETYRRLLTRGLGFDAVSLGPEPSAHPEASTDRRAFALSPSTAPTERGVRYVGSAVNELHRRIAFAGGRPAVNIHAQVVTFGADESGRWYVRATLGRAGGEEGNEAAFGLSFSTPSGSIGAAEVYVELDPGDDREVLLHGTSTAVSGAFGALVRAEVWLFANHHGRRPDKSGRERSTEAISLFGE